MYDPFLNCYTFDTTRRRKPIFRRGDKVYNNLTVSMGLPMKCYTVTDIDKIILPDGETAFRYHAERVIGRMLFKRVIMPGEVDAWKII